MYSVAVNGRRVSHHIRCPLQVGVQSIESNQEERLRLKKLSDERAAKWPNTLEVRSHAAAQSWVLYQPFGHLMHRLREPERSVLGRSGRQQRRWSD